VKYLTIGQLAKQAGVNIDTIRYYERIGLLYPALRKESGYRQYLDDAVLRIRFIRHAKDLGFSLDEISELLSLKLDRAAKCGDIKKRAQRKIIEIEGKMQMLERMRVTLVRLTKTCDEGRQVSECPILEALDTNDPREEMTGLMDRIGETVKGNIIKAKLNPTEEAMRKYILGKFAQKGKAPSLAEIMMDLKLTSIATVNRSLAKLEKNDIVLRRDGELVSSYPFSARETRHRVIFEDGHEVYALCSTDALGIHFMLDENITVLSRCPETEKKITIIVKNGRIKSCNPGSTVEFVSQGESGCCTAETFCPHMNFFYSKEHLEKWREKNPKYRNGEIYLPDETLKHGKNIFGRFLGDYL
jgi:Cu(I)-responsive transcriptional regulator